MASLRKDPRGFSKFWYACITVPGKGQTQRCTKIVATERNRGEAMTIAEKWEREAKHLGPALHLETGDSFKRHVESLVATYEDMGKDLFSEKTVLTKMWKRREQQLGRVTASITSFYGDLQTIAGAGTLPEFASLELAGLVVEENNAPSQARLQQPALI